MSKHNCPWTDDGDGNWETDCGEMFTLIDGTPAENGMRFCCFCGGKLIEKAWDSY